MGDNSVKDSQPAVTTGKFKALKSEFRKIIWPSKSDVSKQSVAVIIVTIIIAAIIAGLDLVFKTGIDKLLNL